VAQGLVFQVERRRFTFVNTHLHHPPEAKNERVQQVEYLLAWLDRGQRGIPVVIAGDFNSYVDEQAVKVMKSRYRSAFEAANGREPEKTWPTPVNEWDDSAPGTLDYIYVSGEVDVVGAGLAFDRHAADDPQLFPSDHLGVWARVII
jgi:endonuclease/exonuclease/phosphatase family metal-dependent hydrolase